MVGNLEELVERLSAARCTCEEDLYGMRSTRWLHLRQVDLDLAIEYLKQELNNRQAKTNK